MNRIQQTFQRLAEERKAALITFITAGDPDVDSTVPAMHALVEGGADILELGVPFTDPEADGPAIQRSSERALKNGVTLKQTLDLVSEFRRSNPQTPVILMGYLNPILALGIDQFAHLARQCGVDGVILVNLPPEEAMPFRQVFDPLEIDLVMLVAPTSNAERIRLISEVATGFIYYVSIKGITGADHLDVLDVERHHALLRRHTQLPISVGFGIKTAEDAKSIASIADGVVVGSALVNTMANTGDRDARLVALREQVRELSEGIHNTEISS